MFSNIGGKIKGLAALISWLGILASLIGGGWLAYKAYDVAGEINELMIPGLAVAVIGSLVSWIGSFLLYGFGQLIYNTDKIAARLDSRL